MKCEATIDPIYWKTPYEYRRCSHTASIIIDEVHLCAQHAGQIALVIMLSNKEIVKLDKSILTCKCESTTFPCFWWMGKDHIEFPDCSRNATYSIFGTKVCANHAWAIVIQKLMSDGRAHYIGGKAPDHICPDRWAAHMR